MCTPLAVSEGWAAVALLVAHQVIGDGGRTVHDVHDRSLRQTAVAASLLARVDAGIRSAGQCATLCGAAVGGLLGDALGARSVLVLAAATLAMAAVFAAFVLARRIGPTTSRA
jgi:predicted MFS family arabinose efflux permease